MKTLKNIYSLIERLEKKDGFLLNEITIKDKWQKESNKWQGKLDAETFEYLCSLDPTTNPNKVGRYANWILAKYNPNADFDTLKVCLEWYADGIKRGIINRLGISNDINAYKSYDEFISAMNGIMHSGDSGMSNSEYNNRQKLEGQFDILGSNSMFDIIACKTFAAERYFGSGTGWCTVANENYFNSYMKHGQLYIIYPKNGNEELKMQFHFESNSFADKDDNVYKEPFGCIKRTIQDENIQNELFELCQGIFPQHKGKFMSFEEAVNFVKQQLANGENPKNVFDNVGYFSEGFTIVDLKDKCNFINTESELLSDQWFDSVDNFREGFAKVKLNGKRNYINTEGNIISDQWFDDVSDFENGLGEVKLNDKYNLINKDGKLISNQWFDSVMYIEHKYWCVRIGNKYYDFVYNDGLYDLDGNKINNIIGENKMRQRVRLTESSLRRMIKESIRQVLNEGPIPNQVNHSTQMQGAVNNGTQNEWANDYLAEKNTYYGYIAKIAKENNTSYTNVISNLQKKVTYYLNNGYFGNNKEVTSTIQLFTELLSYMHGAYESALSRVVKGMQNEASPLQRLKDYIVYPKSNSYGVQQRVNDKSGNEFAIQQGNGQWMSDLQSELQQLLKWNFLHGKKTVAATELFIKFLEVEKRTMFKWFSKNESKIITSMKQALIGVTMLASGLGMLGIGNTNNGNNTMQQPTNNIEMTQQAPQQQTVQQGVNVSFQINQSTLSQEDIQQLQSLPQGNYKIVIHNTQNSSGKDASYDGELAQQRANQIAKYLKGSQVRYSRGSNVNGSSASAEIIPM